MTVRDRVLGGIIGHVVGDALGVPVEFVPRKALKKNPVVDMRGYGTYNQPAGTWSDDTSMMLATMDSLLACKKFDAEDMALTFLNWMQDGAYTPHGVAFDVGSTTRLALNEYAITGQISGQNEELSNGNGSLMRMLPIALCKTPTSGVIKKASAITHGHERTIIACKIYCGIVDALMSNATLTEAIDAAMRDLPQSTENAHYTRLYYLDELQERNIKSDGYVVSTLEAALWCALTTDNFQDCVIRAVNLGNDSDTVAAIAGDFAGLMYGINAIPKAWIDALQCKEYLLDMAEKFYQNGTQHKRSWRGK